MPIDANARGLSFIAAGGLFCTALVLAYLNSTTSNPFWSSVYLVFHLVTIAAMLLKLAMAFGVESGLVNFGDRISSIVPFAALYFNGVQALHYTRDGADGFWAFFAMIALGIVIFSGVTDSIASLIGAKYRDVSSRVGAAADAFQTNNRR